MVQWNHCSIAPLLGIRMSLFSSLSRLAGTGSAPKKPAGPSKAEKRLARVASMRNKAPAAKSAAHEGVKARPMDAQLSRILDQKRAAMRAGGTSAARLGQRSVEPEPEAAEDVPVAEGDAERQAMKAANSEEEKAKRATSASRLKTPTAELGLKPPPHRAEPPDMEI